MMRFLLFLAIVLAVYSALHALVWWALGPILPTRPGVRLALRFAVLAAIVSPLLVALVERAGADLAARGLAMAAFTWMGFIFLAFSLSVLLALWELVVMAGGRWLPSLTRLSIHGPQSATILVTLTVLLGCYGLWEATALRVERVSIPCEKLDPAGTGLRLALVSDLHLGLIRRTASSRRVIELLKQEDPDLLLVAGDFLDGRLLHQPELARMWAEYRPPAGKFAVVGNHEIYPGLKQSLRFLAAAGFRVLRNESLPLEPGMVLVGIDDDRLLGPGADLAPLAHALDQQRYTILLKHRPTVDLDTLPFDLQLSGHAHRGQIFPFSLVTGWVYPLQCGLHQLDNGAYLYTSRGTGTWGPPMRVLSPPEITILTLGGIAGR